jgi:hypothetical protein
MLTSVRSLFARTITEAGSKLPGVDVKTPAGLQSVKTPGPYRQATMTYLYVRSFSHVPSFKKE